MYKIFYRSSVNPVILIVSRCFAEELHQEETMEHKGTATLETPRLILRRFTVEDAEAVYKNWASDERVTKYLTWLAHANTEVSREYMRWCVSGYEQSNFYQWGIVLKESGEPVGNISVVRLDEETDSAEIGYVLGHAFWGNGYMTEALVRVIGFLFDEAGAKRVCARHDVENLRSGRVMQKAGMHYEGTLRQSGRNSRGIVDLAVYSILESEYNNR